MVGIHAISLHNVMNIPTLTPPSAFHETHQLPNKVVVHLGLRFMAPILSQTLPDSSPREITEAVVARDIRDMTEVESATGIDAIVVAVFLSIAIYNFIELNFIILATFKRKGGLYFWSFIVATWGIPPYSIGFLLKNFLPDTSSYIYVTLIVVGWWPLVTGQSMVLYSRLHLVLRKPAWLKAVLIMIIVNAVICYVPTTVMVYGANSSNPGPFVTPYSIYEKIQVTIFFIQEMIISGLYIYSTTKILRIDAVTGRNESRDVMRHLIAVSVIVVILDITILAFEYANLYYLQTSYKALAYSVKLKIEFSILNRLIVVTQGRKCSSCTQSTECSGGMHSTRRQSDGGRPFQPRHGSRSTVRPGFGSRDNSGRIDGPGNKDGGPSTQA
ncbi:hypothetical protein CEP52_008658 [Fusarium oligoseptatum]|uniref:DUF7703 domain-containing protein n=1 Tax=Fusarium oligoseptatum TaxID=2604345 RepID=A0A428TGP2_9HYPO|nr:hypothetical protein CEP52_008658 [Fusarium oligoseptatum]